MNKKKKIFTISAFGIAVLIPIIGRMIGEWSIQSQYVPLEERSQIPDFQREEDEEKNKEQVFTRALKSEIEQSNKFMETYTMTITDKGTATLSDETGASIMQDIISIEHVDESYFILVNIDGSYIWNAKQMYISESLAKAQKVTIQRETKKEVGILYQGGSEPFTWSLQSMDTLYENVIVDESNLTSKTTFNIVNDTVTEIR